MRWFDRITEGGAGVTASGSGALRAPLAIGLQGDGWALRAPPSVLRRSGCRLRSAEYTMSNPEWLTVNSVVSASRGNIKVVSMSRKSGKAKLYQGRGLVVRQPKAVYAKGLQRAYAKEKGYLDTPVAPYSLDTTGSVTLLNAVPQGAGVTQRVGKKIAMKGLQCRGLAQNGSTATANDVALMIVYDKRPTGALPAVADIILSPTTATSMNNDANAGRFSILKRWDAVLVGNLSAPANYTETSVLGTDFWLDLKSRSVVYKAAGTGAIGDIEEGALYLVTIGGQAATAGAALIAGFRMRFLDV